MTTLKSELMHREMLKDIFLVWCYMAKVEKHVCYMATTKFHMVFESITVEPQ